MNDVDEAGALSVCVSLRGCRDGSVEVEVWG